MKDTELQAKEESKKKSTETPLVAVPIGQQAAVGQVAVPPAEPMVEPPLQPAIMEPIPGELPQQPMVLAPDVTTTVKTIPGTSIPQNVLTAQLSAGSEMQSLVQKQAKIEQENAEKVAQAGIERDIKVSELDAAYQTKIAKQEAQQAEALTKLQEIQAERKNYVFRPDGGFWGEGGERVGKSLMAGIAVGLGAIGSKMAGGPNLAANILDQKVKNAIDQQNAEYAKLGDKAVGQQNIIANLRQQGLDQNQAYSVAKAQLLDETARKVEQIAAASKSDMVKVRADQLLAELKQKSAMAVQDYLKATASKTEIVTTSEKPGTLKQLQAMQKMEGDGRPATESEQNWAYHGTRMKSALPTIKKYVDASFISRLASKNSWTNWAASTEGQLFEDAANEFVSAAIRKETGAAIGKDEFTKKYKELIPQFGDSPETVKQKLSRMEKNVTIFLSAGGVASKQMERGLAQMEGQSTPYMAKSDARARGNAVPAMRSK